ncbi:hypothetical protein M758_4G097100 [Ceratodon purpureus]|uniref:Uncharacterized protein n=1 Tax=Ceratodon purpureus TaxID=3225 RepID=A0A8T0IA85_CERPU|nr:hypothetical protein KC19_4G096700 [Ceratodon purpureus]KAG0579421.1 hypothetical protein KC19_4G097500 [Ceratodon purpureus]KAG0618870.1 hypothetical protein M758_4G097100 [Ceratodon purpureus]
MYTLYTYDHLWGPVTPHSLASTRGGASSPAALASSVHRRVTAQALAPAANPTVLSALGLSRRSGSASRPFRMPTKSAFTSRNASICLVLLVQCSINTRLAFAQTPGSGMIDSRSGLSLGYFWVNCNDLVAASGLVWLFDRLLVV